MNSSNESPLYVPEDERGEALVRALDAVDRRLAQESENAA